MKKKRGKLLGDALRGDFVTSGLTLAEAASHQGVSLETAKRWKREAKKAGDDWEAARIKGVACTKTSRAASSPKPQKKPGSSLSGRVAMGKAAGNRGSQWLAGERRDYLVERLLEDYLQLHLEAVEAVQDQVEDPLGRVDALARLSQALDRTLRSLGRASPELSRLAVAKAILEKQAEFVKLRFPNHMPAFLEVLEPFGDELAQSLNS
ncbi:MAG: DUF1804 family protein [Magnetococcales bacterium]|nr:DUF1804 family protein [Magnetococcales bacterium]